MYVVPTVDLAGISFAGCEIKWEKVGSHQNLRLEEASLGAYSESIISGLFEGK